jgi:hypothetical protein
MSSNGDLQHDEQDGAVELLQPVTHREVYRRGVARHLDVSVWQY